MPVTDTLPARDDLLHPIDLVEALAQQHDWAFDRLADDQIAMEVEGQWRTYAITLAWSGRDETLRLICTFSVEPPAHRLGAFLDLLNGVNERCWDGAFTYWDEQGLMVWRYGLVLDGGQMAAPGQIDRMVAAAVESSERFYPAFQLVAWSEQDADAALQVAIGRTYGRA